MDSNSKVKLSMMLSVVSSYDATSNRVYTSSLTMNNLALPRTQPTISNQTLILDSPWICDCKDFRISTYFKTINRECVTEKVEDTNSISLDQSRHLMSGRNASKLFFGFY